MLINEFFCFDDHLCHLLVRQDPWLVLCEQQLQEPSGDRSELPQKSTEKWGFSQRNALQKKGVSCDTKKKKTPKNPMLSGPKPWSPYVRMSWYHARVWTSVLDWLLWQQNVQITMFLTGNIVYTPWQTMFWKDFLYLYLSWPAALDHGKFEENIVNSCFFKGLKK